MKLIKRKTEQTATASPLIQKPKLGGVALSFLLGCAVALAIFVPFLIVDSGFFLYAGDYNSQQISFYSYVQQFLKTGGGTWSWATDLGSSFITSYSFYNLGSPFLWITLPFPNSWMPYLMVPLFCLKFGSIAAAACLYLQRYAKTRNMAVIVSLAYAFCGFNVYNIFFNHMLDAVVYFPLILWAMDGFVYEKRRGFFALFVGLALLNSYFFFIGNVVFALIYFVVKVACKEYKITLGRFAQLGFEAVLGVGIGMVLLLPSVLNLMGNPRTDNFASGFGMMIYGNSQQYFAILSSMFLPPDAPYIPNIFTDATIKWTSMSAFLPIVSMAGVFAYCRSRKGGSIKILLYISLLMAFIPILNSSFYAFNSSYYARWFYMPLLFACFATLRSLEDPQSTMLSGIKITAGITAAFAVFALLPTKENNEWTLGVVQQQSKFWLTWLTAMLGILAFYVLWRGWRGRARFAPLLLAAVMSFSVMYSVIHISLGKFPQWEGDAGYRDELYISAAQAELPTDGFYRVDSHGTQDNIGLWMNKSGLQTFNSVVSNSIMEFYPLVGVSRDVASRPDIEEFALRSLLSVRYTLVTHNKVEEFLATENTDGWEFWRTEGEFAIYENQNYVPFGFTYDEYVDMDHLAAINEGDRASILMRAIGLTEEQQAEYAHLFSGYEIEWQSNGTAGETGEETGWYSYGPTDYGQFVEDCNARRQTSSYVTYYDASGFTSKIVLPKENLVFFSVPWDEGFTATVNGQPTEILHVSGGLSAVYAPAGDNEIIFEYKTPGFALGGVVTLASLLILFVYMLLTRRYSNRTNPHKLLKAAAQKDTQSRQNECPSPAVSTTQTEEEEK